MNGLFSSKDAEQDVLKPEQREHSFAEKLAAESCICKVGKVIAVSEVFFMVFCAIFDKVLQFGDIKIVIMMLEQ